MATKCCESREINLFVLQDLTLLVKRESRKAEWEAFIRDMGEKCARVDQTFKQKEAELREYYSDLEKKLHLEDN